MEWWGDGMMEPWNGLMFTEGRFYQHAMPQFSNLLELPWKLSVGRRLLKNRAVGVKYRLRAVG